MPIVVPDVLNEDEIRTVSATVKQADFTDGRETAGARTRGIKNNLQTHDNTDPALQALILAALARKGLCNTVAAPKKIIPPRFKLYKEGMYYGDHVDNAIMQDAGAPLRVDMSFTLFISGPKDYGGGELVIKGPQGPTPFKLPAGHMIVYPTYYYHEVTPVTRGERAGLRHLAVKHDPRFGKARGAARTGACQQPCRNRRQSCAGAAAGPS
jgi:PKHD-type hydroxylase